MYKKISNTLNLKFEEVFLKDDFSLDTELMLEKIKEFNPAIIFLAFPNNPTGNLWSKNDIDLIKEIFKLERSDSQFGTSWIMPAPVHQIDQKTKTELTPVDSYKKIILDKMSDPPSLEQLSIEVELSLKKLKDGFKQIYGDTVFAYLLDHKMDEDRKMLDSRKYNVNEVSLKLGYSTASHFIAAFKKKYGTTPKKYIGSVS